jgi:hypothetical protein
MDPPEMNEARSLRHLLNELIETQRWFHHVADLNSEEVLSFPLDRPVTPLSRAERLSRFGHLIDTSMI